MFWDDPQYMILWTIKLSHFVLIEWSIPYSSQHNSTGDNHMKFIISSLVHSGFLCLWLKGTREAAFVHSISAAGVGYEVTRSCSSGDLQKCGCDRTVTGTSDEGFTWSGCSDNVNYGRSSQFKVQSSFICSQYQQVTDVITQERSV